jgi:hypothetical protein
MTFFASKTFRFSITTEEVKRMIDCGASADESGKRHGAQSKCWFCEMIKRKLDWI